MRSKPTARATGARVDAYTVEQTVPGLDPTRYFVSTLVARRDGRPMTEADLAACAVALPRKSSPRRKTAPKRAAAHTARPAR